MNKPFLGLLRRFLEKNIRERDCASFLVIFTSACLSVRTRLAK